MHHRRSPVVRRHDDSGATLVEYALMLGLIAVVAFGAVTFFGNSGDGLMKNNCDEISSAMGLTC